MQKKNPLHIYGSKSNHFEADFELNTSVATRGLIYQMDIWGTEPIHRTALISAVPGHTFRNRQVKCLHILGNNLSSGFLLMSLIWPSKQNTMVLRF